MTIAQHQVLRLPLHPTSASIARTKLAAFLTLNYASESVIDDALLVLSEMTANAITHGRPTAEGTVEMSWAIKKGLLEISVRDAGDGAALQPVDFDEDSLSGRGLSIISRVADRWWVDMTQGTCVSAELTYR